MEISHYLGTGLYPRLRRRWAFMVLPAIILIYFAPILLSGRVISPTSATLYSIPPWSAAYPGRAVENHRHFGDVIDFYFPATLFLKHWVQQGILPLWDPTVTSGQPFILSLYFFLYPLNWLYLLLPLEAAFTVHLLGRLLLAGAFTFLVAREFKLPPAASLLAALAFTFNGFHLVWAGWPHTSVSSLLPLLLWAVMKAINTKQDRYLLLLSLVVVMLLAGGFLPVAGYALYAAAGLGLFLLWKQYRPKDRSRTLKEAARIGLFMGLGILISAVHLFPFLENLLQSGYGLERGQDQALYRYFHLPWWQLIMYAMPGYYGGITTPYWGSVNFVEVSGYIGLIPFSLALISLGRLRYPSLRTPGYYYSLALAVVSLGVTYGIRPVSIPVTMLPGLQLAINTRLLVLAAFGLALLAGHGLGFLRYLERHRGRAHMLKWAAVAAGSIISLVVATELYWNFSPGRPGEVNAGLSGVFGPVSPIKVTLYAALRQGNRAALVSAAVFGAQMLAVFLLFTLYYRSAITRFGLHLALIMLAAADLLFFAAWYLPAGKQSTAYPLTPALRTALDEPQPMRFMAIGSRVLPGNMSSVYQLHNATGHSIFHPGRYTKYLSLLDKNAWNRREHGTHILVGQHISDFDSRLVDLLGIQYILERPGSMEDLKRRTIVSQVEHNVPVGEIYGAARQGQSFVSTADNLNEIKILMATYARMNSQEIIFRLRAGPDAREDLALIRKPAGQVEDNQWATFSFPPIPDSAGREFYFYLESPSSRSGDAVTVWSTDWNAYPAGQRYVDGRPAEGDLAFMATASADIPARFDLINLMPEMLAFKNSQAMPRVYAVSRSIVIKDEAEVLRYLQSTEFDPRREVILEEAGETDPATAAAAGATLEAAIKSYEPNRVIVEANLSEAGWLVLNDPNYPGWTATVDGRPEQVYQANYLFRAVAVPAGRHTVIFSFRPASVISGLIVSLAAVIGLAAVLGVGRHRPARRSQVQPVSMKDEL